LQHQPVHIVTNLCINVPGPAGAVGLHCFEVKGTFNPTTKKLSAPPADFSAPAAAAGGATAMEVDRQAAAAGQQQQQLDASLAMSSMDIFAGCGGLSEGMHQVCVWMWLDMEIQQGDARGAAASSGSWVVQALSGVRVYGCVDVDVCVLNTFCSRGRHGCSSSFSRFNGVC
jgi:hypothetical protein